jgi:predicted dehydrogenase
MHLTDEQKQIGKDNFQDVIGATRREFLLGTLAASAVAGASLGSLYFGYEKSIPSPLRVGVIGAGDEGNVLIGAINPNFIQVVAISEIRPYNVWRAFHGDYSSDNALKVRCGLMKKYGWATEDQAKANVKVYDQDYHELLDNPDIEGVIIALPLHLHHIVAIEAMAKGKHVLTEKLMGHSVAKCKEMARVAAKLNKHLVTGHQRHYSILYDNAVDTIKRGLIGDIHHIRAQWHRGNLPGSDSWQMPLPGDEKIAKNLAALQKQLAEAESKPLSADKSLNLRMQLEQIQAQLKDAALDAEKFGYQKFNVIPGDNSTERSAMEELIRWRLWTRTGGGLMAELGSHQLDASGILISAMHGGEKALPLSITAMGGRHIFPADRQCEDHVYCLYEFPGPKYKDDPNNIIGVSYSSINGNGYGGYGEVVLGTKGTLILDSEKEAMLFETSKVTTRVGVSEGKGGPVLDTTASGAGHTAVGKAALESGPISRGYMEEMEHWAYCVRSDAARTAPRCYPKIALGDAVIALTTNIALRSKGEQARIVFKKEWFDVDSDETPEGIPPDLSQYKV